MGNYCVFCIQTEKSSFESLYLSSNLWNSEFTLQGNVGGKGRQQPQATAETLMEGKTLPQEVDW